MHEELLNVLLSDTLERRASARSELHDGREGVKVYQPRSRCCARCSTCLALDNSDRLCAACRSKASDELVKPPTLPRAFWVHDHLREALDSWHFGRLIATYRSHLTTAGC